MLGEWRTGTTALMGRGIPALRGKEAKCAIFQAAGPATEPNCLGADGNEYKPKRLASVRVLEVMRMGDNSRNE